jgi:hypothetical protein
VNNQLNPFAAPASFRLVTATYNPDRIVAFDEEGEHLGIVALVINERLCKCLLEKANPPGGETRRAAEKRQ